MHEANFCLQIHDGRYTTNDTLADYTGSLSGIKVNNSTGQYMLLDFKADGSNVDVGFRADVYKVKIWTFWCVLYIDLYITNEHRFALINLKVTIYAAIKLL